MHSPPPVYSLPTSRLCACLIFVLSACLSACEDISNKDPHIYALVFPPSSDLPHSGFEHDQPITPLPLHTPIQKDKAKLGQALFGEPLLSGDGSVSCASCHPLDRGGTLNAPVAHLPNRPPTKANVPTVFNAVFNFRLNWDGSHETLEALVDVPMLGEAAMASSWNLIVERLLASPVYRPQFEAIYPDGVTAQNVRDAIVAYERTLTTPNAPFDRYLRGDTSAISDRQREGFLLFKNLGCASCHQGVNVGGNMFQTFGVMEDYFANRPTLSKADLGRYAFTQRDGDRFVFRVPGLRNVALTAPYFHDGSAQTLDAAIAIMARYQLGRSITDHQIALIAAFLDSLTGEYQGLPP